MAKTFTPLVWFSHGPGDKINVNATVRQLFAENAHTPAYSPELFQRITGTEKGPAERSGGSDAERRNQESSESGGISQENGQVPGAPVTSDSGPNSGPGSSNVNEWKPTTFGTRGGRSMAESYAHHKTALLAPSPPASPPDSPLPGPTAAQWIRGNRGRRGIEFPHSHPWFQP